MQGIKYKKFNVLVCVSYVLEKKIMIEALNQLNYESLTIIFLIKEKNLDILYTTY
jgi:hypothetical protein